MTRFRLAASASAFALFACVTLPGAALAQEAAADPIGAAIDQAADPAAEDQSALASGDLADISGGASLDIEDSAISTQELTANTSDNSIGGNVGTGQISFSEGAFSNFSGVGNVVVNTGVQANIQGSINVTINGTSF